MTPRNRRAWIAQWLRTHHRSIPANTANPRFVWDYVFATGADCDVPADGQAPRCDTLRADLLAMYKLKVLERDITPLGRKAWVYTYRLRATK